MTIVKRLVFTNLIMAFIPNAYVCFQKEPLLNEEKIEYRNIAVSVKDITARWTPAPKTEELNSIKCQLNGVKDLVCDNLNTPALLNVSIDFKRGNLIGIIGSVGSGKTSLLQALLRELPVKSGSISVSGSIAYNSQEPWLYSGTVRQNILFNQPMQRSRYNSVIKSCALLEDFESFEYGDRTAVGERGVSLSGGQKARIK